MEITFFFRVFSFTYTICFNRHMNSELSGNLLENTWLTNW